MVAEAQQVAQSTGVLSSLGIDWKLFIAQLVNVSVVVFVMWRWVYRPLMKVLDERTRKIEKGLQDAQEAAASRQAAGEERQKIVIEARQKAKDIGEEAAAAASAERDAAVRKAREDVEKLVAQGKEQLKDEKARMIEEVRAEVGELVALAVEKIAAERLDPKKDEALIRKALAGSRD